jgi:hypothetical protein
MPKRTDQFSVSPSGIEQRSFEERHDARRVIDATRAIRRPLVATRNPSVPTGTSTITIAVPTGELHSLKTIAVTPGANTTVTSIKIDGVAIEEVATVDLVAQYGETITAATSVTVDVNNTGAAATTTVKLKGFFVRGNLD